MARIEDLTYPVLMFRDGYVFKAEAVSELLVHDSRTFEDIRLDCRVVDSTGWYGRVVRWEEVARPPGLKAVIDALQRSNSVRPVIEFTERKTLLVRDIEPMLINGIRFIQTYERLYGKRPSGNPLTG